MPEGVDLYQDFRCENQAEKAYFFRVRSKADQSSEDAVFAIVLVFVFDD